MRYADLRSIRLFELRHTVGIREHHRFKDL